MPISIQCNKCERRFNAPDSALGKTAACPGCGNKLVIEQVVEESNNKFLVAIGALLLVGISCVGAVAYVTSKSEPQPVAKVDPPVVDATTQQPTAEPIEPEQVEETESPIEPEPSEETEPTIEPEPEPTPGLGLTLEQFKKDIPADAWKELADTTRDDGTVSYQMVCTTLQTMILAVHGDPNDLREVSLNFSITSDMSDIDVATRVALMAFFYEKYSNWTKEELGEFWRRLITVGMGGEDKVKIQKDGHEFFLMPMGADDGTLFITAITSTPDSTALTLEEWLEAHPLKIPSGLYESKVRSGEIAGGDFTFRSFRHKGDSDFIGEITNESGNDYQLASFKMSLYDSTGELLDTAAIIVNNISAGQTKSFEAYIEDVPSDYLYKIDFENGIE
jgi:hypothetical protein